ncbi:MAG TPA: cytochrome c-type biogenesis protein [Gemmatimonadaceae bacterium]|nr:cytochrome c-type biogenesis protein [Gemmatimonadaceae bacterium]
MRKSTIAVAVFAALSAFTAIPANTQTTQVADSTLEARTSAVASTLRCPVCQGESIQDSPSELAQQMRAVVRDRLRSGQSPDQVKAYFVSRYGEWILLEPKMTGLNVMLYVLPIVIVIGGLILIVVLVRRWTKPAEAGEG